MKPCALRPDERGATLLVALILLVLLTLVVLTGFNLGKSNLLIVSNQQFRGEAVESANSALEEILSRSHFADTPASPFGTTNTKSYDVNGDNKPDVTVKVGDTDHPTTNPPPCIKSFQVLPVDPNDTENLGCASQVQQSFGVAGGATWGSQCADVIWEVTAVATDSTTQASATMATGIRIRQDANATVITSHYCP